MSTTTSHTAVTLDVARIRKDFPALDQLVHGKPLAYLDNAASAQTPIQVIDAIRGFYDPSVSFELEFDVPSAEEEEAHSAEITAYPAATAEKIEEAPDDKPETGADDDGNKPGGASVVSLDSFRKKN